MLVGGEGEGSEELGGKKGSTWYTTPRFSMTVDSLILDLKEKVPELIDFYVLRKKLDLKYNPLHVVLS